jgi:hypothetical protein
MNIYLVQRQSAPTVQEKSKQQSCVTLSRALLIDKRKIIKQNLGGFRTEKSQFYNLFVRFPKKESELSILK